jgi:hypothetical protein
MKYLAYIATAVIAALTVLPGAALAQSAIGAQVDHNKKRMTDFDDLFFQNSARAGINVVSLCMAEKRPVQAMKTLSHGFMSGEQAKSLDRFFKRFFYDSSCNLTRQVETDVPSVPVIGGLAEYFLIRKYDSEDRASLDAMTETDWQAGTMKPHNSNEMFGQCVVRADRTAIFNLVNTIPDTDSEAESIEAIVPSLGPCVTDGQEVAFDKTSLRAILAFSLYRAVSQYRKESEAAE